MWVTLIVITLVGGYLFHACHCRALGWARGGRKLSRSGRGWVLAGARTRGLHPGSQWQLMWVLCLDGSRPREEVAMEALGSLCCPHGAGPSGSQAPALRWARVGTHRGGDEWTASQPRSPGWAIDKGLVPSCSHVSSLAILSLVSKPTLSPKVLDPLGPNKVPKGQGCRGRTRSPLQAGKLLLKPSSHSAAHIARKGGG